MNKLRHHRSIAAFLTLVVAAGVFGLYWFQPWKLWTTDVVNEVLPVAAATAAPVAKDPSNLVTVGLAAGDPAAAPSTTVTTSASVPGREEPVAATIPAARSFPSRTVSTTMKSAHPTTAAPAATRPGVIVGSGPVASTPPSAEPIQLLVGHLISHEHSTSGIVRVIGLPDGSRVLTLENLSTSEGPDVHVWLATAPVLEGDDGWHVFDDDAHVDLGGLKGNRGNQVYPVPADLDLSKFRSATIWCERFSVSFGAAALS